MEMCTLLRNCSLKGRLVTAQVMLLILWEAKSLKDKQYISLSEQLNEVGRQLGGWHGQLAKKFGKQNPAGLAGK